MAGRKTRHFRLSDPAILRNFASEHLHRLLLPHREYFAGRGYILPRICAELDLERLASIMVQTDQSAPWDLIDALTHIQEACSPNLTEHLSTEARRRGISLPSDGTSPEDVALIVWLNDPDLLRKYHAQTTVLRRRSFDHFAWRGADPLKVPSDLDCKVSEFEAGIRAWCSQHQRGSHARVLRLDEGEELRLVVTHGAPFCRRGCFQGEAPSTVAFQPMEFSYLVLNWTHGTSRINAGTAPFCHELRRLASTVLLGGTPQCLAREVFTLKPLRRGLSALVCSDIPGLERVTLRSLRMQLTLSAGRYRTEEASDLMAVFEREAKPPDIALFESAKLDFKFAHSPRPRPVSIQDGNRSNYTRDEDGDQIEQFFRARGFIRSGVDRVGTP